MPEEQRRVSSAPSARCHFIYLGTLEGGKYHKTSKGLRAILEREWSPMLIITFPGAIITSVLVLGVLEWLVMNRDVFYWVLYEFVSLKNLQCARNYRDICGVKRIDDKKLCPHSMILEISILKIKEIKLN